MSSGHLRETLPAVDGAPAASPCCLSPASFWAPQHILESAWLEHAPFAFWLMDAMRPRNLVELGTHHGFSYLAFCQAVQRLNLPTACYAIDTWQGDDQAGFYGEEVYNRLSALNARHYAGFSRLIRGLFEQALPYFADGSIDLLHIDGRHTYEDVRQDFESWKPKLSGRGIVLFHDTNVRERDFGVWRLWGELAPHHPSFEFVHGNGLGVLALGPEVPPALQPLFNANPAEQAAIRAAYAHLGSHVSWQFQLEHAHHHLGLRQAEIGRLHAETVAQAASLQDLQSSLAAEQASSAVMRDEVATHARRLGEAQSELAARNAALAAEEQRRAALAEQNRLLQEEQRALVEQGRVLQEARRTQEDDLRRLQAEISEARGLADELRVALHGAHSEKAEALQELVRFHGSTLWRATAPLRSSLEQLPSPVRMNLRRSVKAAWWMLTPHRLPQRLAFLRARRLSLTPAPAPAAAMPAPADLPEQAPLPVAAPAPRFLSFQPGPAGSGSDEPADRNGRYQFAPVPPGYTYVPPQRPVELERILAGLARRPRFSIVVPTYNTTTDLLSRLLASVRSQWYPDWQLVLADDASPSEATRRELEAIDDPRVTVVFSPTNRGISGATNLALEQARGDYIVFLDHDDELTADCLYELALCINREDPDYIYSDEDKITPEGSFTQPFFKPDWSPDTMMSTMYTCHVSCVRRSLLEAVGPLRSAFDGAQDWDLVLRITERAKRIAHIPKVLYHWRIIPASIATDMAAKPYAIEASRKLRAEAIERRGLSGALEPLAQVPGYFRVRYALQGDPRISIIIPTRDNGAVLQRCVDSIRQHSTHRNFEFVVLDNGSVQAETLAVLRALDAAADATVVRHDAPFNYSELNNLGARHARGTLLLFLNDDTEVLSPDWLERMGGYAQLPHSGAVGAKLIYPGSRRVQHSGLLNLADGPSHAFLHRDADEPGYFMRNLLEYDWAAVTGACLMVERAKFEQVGGFDETFPVAYNDVELCFRLLRQGLYNLVCPSVELLHHESLSRGLDQETPERRARLEADRLRLYLAHPDMLMRDPFHNPNLHPNNVQFELPA